MAECVPPGSPSPATATAGQNQAEVVWHAAAENGTAISAYLVTAYQGSTPQYAVATDGGSTSATISGLVGGTAYTFQVAAQSACGTGAPATTAAVTPTGASSTYASTVLADGPAAYFQLNERSGEAAADSSGHGLTAFYNRENSFGGHDVLGTSDNPLVSDPQNTSVDFVDANNCCYTEPILDSSAAGLPTAGKAVTVEFWFKVSANWNTPIDALNLVGDLHVVLANRALITVNGLNFDTPYQISDGAWHMLSVVDDQHSLTAYLDGQTIGSQSGSGKTAGATALTIGRVDRGPMDEAAVYSKALTATQVAAHFAASGDTRPTQPAEVKATPGTNNLAVSWSASTATVPAGEAPVTFFLVRASKSTGKVVDALVVPASSSAVTLSGLVAGTEYEVHVIPYNEFGAGAERISAPATPTGASSTYASNVLADSPAAYFRLNDLSGPVAADSSGHELAAFYNYDTAFGGQDLLGSTENPLLGDAQNTSVEFVDARNCCYRDGMVDPSSNGLPGAGQAVTAEFWFKGGSPVDAVDLLGDLHVIISNSSTIAVNGLQFTTPGQVSDGAWHMVDVVDDGVNSITVYLDGQLIESQSGSGPTAGASGLEIGRMGRGPMDEVAIYAKGLTASRVAAHFKASGQAGPQTPSGMSVLYGTAELNGQGAAQGARVQACPTSGAGCIVNPEPVDSNGWFRMLVPNDTYAVTIFPPSGSPSGPKTIGPLTVPPSPLHLAATFTPPGGLPSGVTFSSPSTGAQQNVVPRVNWGEPSTVTVTGCAGGFGVAYVRGTNTSTGQVETRTATLVETPSGSGNYVAQIAPLVPIHGSGSVSESISCPGHTHVLPDGGPPAGGTSVLVSGSGFTGAKSVQFGSAPATSFSVLQDNLISAVAPPGTAGTSVPVSVVTSSGSTVGIGTFDYFDIAGLDTTTGPATGGNTVTIQGHGFTNVKGVIFGLTSAASFTVLNETELQAKAPPGVGTVDVQVLNGFAISQTTSADFYTYQNGPPGSGSINEGVGTGAPTNLAAQLSDYCTDPNCVSQSPIDLVPLRDAAHDQLTGIFGAGPIGVLFQVGVTGVIVGAACAIDLPCDIAVAAVGIGFFVHGLLSLLCTSEHPCSFFGLKIDPSGTVVDTSGNALSNATATLLGQSAEGGAFSPVSASSAAIEPAVNPQVTGASGGFDWNALAGTYEVQASAPGCHAPGNPPQSAVLTSPFVIPPPAVGLTLTLECPGSTPPTPKVTGLSPVSGPTAGGNVVDIVGEGLADATAVHFGSAPATYVKALSPFALVAVAPAGSSASDVTVTTLGGSSVTSEADRYSYIPAITEPGGPQVSSVTPGNGPISGGTVVVINGTNLTGAFAVEFGNTPASHVVDVSSTQVQAVAPAGTVPLRIDVSISTPTGTSAPAAGDGYLYVAGGGSPPEFGRCLKVASEKEGTKTVYRGKFTASTCLKRSSTASGQYEWYSGAVKTGIAISGASATLETAGKRKLVCKAESGDGQLGDARSVAGIVLTFTGCESGGAKCTTSGLAEGELRTKQLEGILGWESKPLKKAALALHAAQQSALFMEYGCAGGGSTKVTGAVLVPVAVDKTSATATLKYAATRGKQKPEAFEGGEAYVLLSSLNGATAEQTGLAMVATETYEEALEINAVV